MTPTHLKWIAITVGALVLIWGISALLPSGTDRAGADFTLPAVRGDSVDRVVIASSRDTLVLARAAPERWTVNGFPASSSSVDELFAALDGGHAPELVARSPASFQRLGVDSGAARRLTISDSGRTVVDLLVSQSGPDGPAPGGTAYVRLPGDSAVYAWSGALVSAARRGADEWRDRTIARIPADSVRRIDVELGARRYSVQRRDSGWALSRGGAADSAAVSRLLARFQSLQANGFPNAAQLDSAFRGRRERRVTLYGGVREGADSTLLSLEFDSTLAGFWVRRREGDFVYRLPGWEVDQLTPHDSTLRRPS